MNLSRAQRVARVEAALSAAGIDGEVVRLQENTATASAAAAALGCSTGEIAKSLMFRRAGGEDAVVAVLSGTARVCATKLSQFCGGEMMKADARFVKERTGFEIGGVPPVAHSPDIRVIMDTGLQQYEKVWAAAGSAHAVFAVTPAQLATVAAVADIAE